MTKEKFTKGPWVVRSNGHYFDIGPESERPSVVPVDHVCIGVPFENEADAHLIEAAPEMYEEIEREHAVLLWEIQNIVVEDDKDAKKLEKLKAVAKRKSAILAKARGEHE